MTTLPAEVVHEARCSHPDIVDRGGAGRSGCYRGAHRLLAPFEVPLAARRGLAEVLGFDAGELAEVRQVVQRRATAARLPASKIDDFVLAVSEIAANSIRHGGGRGVLRVWTAANGVVCEIRARDARILAADLPIVQGGAVMLAAVVNNLLINALRYGPRKDGKCGSRRAVNWPTGGSRSLARDRPSQRATAPASSSHTVVEPTSAASRAPACA